jgi:hypothetical protein
MEVDVMGHKKGVLNGRFIKLLMIVIFYSVYSHN